MLTGNGGTVWRRIGVIFTLALAASHWSEFLSPPLERLAGHDEIVLKDGHRTVSHVAGMPVGELIRELIRPHSPIYNGQFLTGPLFLLSSLVMVFGLFWVVRAIYRYWDASFVPITVLEARFRLDFLDDEMKVARFSRTQIMHANRSGITSYRSVSSVDHPDAEIDLSSISFSSKVGGQSLNGEPPDIMGNKSSVEVNELYSVPLPRNWLVSLLPNRIALWLFTIGALEKPIVTRTGSALYINNYNKPDAWINISSQHPTSLIRLAISFPQKVAPAENNISFRIFSELVSVKRDHDTRFESDRKVYEVTIRGFNAPQLRARWKNESLRGPSANSFASIPFIRALTSLLRSDTTK